MFHVIVESSKTKYAITAQQDKQLVYRFFFQMTGDHAVCSYRQWNIYKYVFWNSPRIVFVLTLESVIILCIYTMYSILFIKFIGTHRKRSGTGNGEYRSTAKC